MRAPALGNHIRSLAATVALVAGLVALVACEPTPRANLVLDGRGSGHGRGMGQWGALGYAVDHGWSGTQILNRFYGGTSTVAVAPSRQRVLLQARTGKDLIAYVQLGTLRGSFDGYSTDHAALRVARLTDNRYRVYGGPGCNGPWSTVASSVSSREVRLMSTVQNDDPRGMVQLCTSSTAATYYRGALIAVLQSGTLQTVNDVYTENYIRSVIAREVSPWWADAGGGKGAAAVRAQAVAARSYALSGDTRWGSLATTCDGTNCQDYRGYGYRTGSTLVKQEDRRTDRATSDTAHQVRKFANGTVARTEFSSSSGGWSAGGTFPAVVDDGDDIADNPNHTWAVTFTAATVEARFDARQGTDVGAYEGIDVLSRNGLGTWGGRVLSVRVRFSKVDVTLTGEQFRGTLGLRSSWYNPRP